MRLQIGLIIYPCLIASTFCAHTTILTGGRLFWSCPANRYKSCKFFSWADAKFPKCEHGKPTVLRRVLKAGANNGRYFFACPEGKDLQCKYFQWSECVATRLMPSATGRNSTCGDMKLSLKRPLDDVTAMKASTGIVSDLPAELCDSKSEILRFRFPQGLQIPL